MILICESCDHGYSDKSPDCPWCGASSALAHTVHATRGCDTECYPNYWLCNVGGESFELFDDHPLDVVGLRRALSRATMITFNGIGYDMPMIAAALAGATNEQLKQCSDALIVGGMKHWEFYRHYGLQEPTWIDHIDMLNVKPGDGGLKILGGKMHTKRMQDLPIEPSSLIHWGQRPLLREYCDNDKQVTEQLAATFKAQIALRESMSAEYGLDLRSKSDAQIAEAVMRKLLPFKVEIPYFAPGAAFNYHAPDWLSFQTQELQRLLETMQALPFHINVKGGVSPNIGNSYIDWGDDAVRLDHHGAWVKRPKDWAPRLVRIGGMNYAVGIGGLHSTESTIFHRADDETLIHAPDVAAYYPSLIVRTGIYPQQIGPIFQQYYSDWKHRRDEAKRAGDKKTANSLKTLNNGTFGKLGSQYSIFYAPSEMIQVTVTGQLALLMLIEMLELSGLEVISANTDGVVVRTPRHMDYIYNDVIAWWESVTGFVMETTDFDLLACRDVNSYIGITTDGSVKLKGAYAPAEPGASGWPNPTGQICVDAVVAYLQHGTPLASTIRTCRDIRKFVYIRAVKGGGWYYPDGVLPRVTTQRRMRELCGDLPKAELIEAYNVLRDGRERELLGKAVRWYYAAGSSGCIATATGGLVARTEGCRPLMELPDDLPSDIDYEWYEREAADILGQIGCGYRLAPND